MIPIPILYYYKAWKNAAPQCNYPELFKADEPCGWFHDWPIQELEIELAKTKDKRKSYWDSERLAEYRRYLRKDD